MEPATIFQEPINIRAENVALIEAQARALAEQGWSREDGSWQVSGAQAEALMVADSGITEIGEPENVAILVAFSCGLVF